MHPFCLFCHGPRLPVRPVVQSEKTSKPAEEKARRGDGQDHEREIEDGGRFRQFVALVHQKKERKKEEYHREGVAREDEERPRQILQLLIRLAADESDMRERRIGVSSYYNMN
jgi:hypothetical protein